MDEMTAPELNQFLEATAERIEAKAKTVSEAPRLCDRKRFRHKK